MRQLTLAKHLFDKSELEIFLEQTHINFTTFSTEELEEY